MGVELMNLMTLCFALLAGFWHAGGSAAPAEEDVSNLDCAALYSQMLLELVIPTSDNMTEENVRRWLSESDQIMPAKYFIERSKQELGIEGDGSASSTTVPFAPLLYARMAELAQDNLDGNIDRVDTLISTCETRYQSR